MSRQYTVTLNDTNIGIARKGDVAKFIDDYIDNNGGDIDSSGFGVSELKKYR